MLENSKSKRLERQAREIDYLNDCIRRQDQQIKKLIEGHTEINAHIRAAVEASLRLAEELSS